MTGFGKGGSLGGFLKMNLTHQELEEIREKDLPSYLTQDGVTLKKLSETSWKGRCPFHEDKNPSFNVNLRGRRWLWHCFGCEKGGDVVRYVMLKEGVSFPEAVKILLNGRNGNNASLPEGKVLKAVAEYYHETLKDSKRAQDYLLARGLFDPALVKEYRIGFSDGSLPKDPELLNFIKDLGILNEKGKEHFTNCLVFPIENLEGEIVSLYGRNISSPQHLYLKGPHKGVFNARSAKGAKRIFITEGIIDALSLVKLGLKESIALYGTSGFTPDHVRILQSSDLEEVWLSLDNDEAGERAVQTLLEKIPSSLRVFKITLPEGIKDPNDFLLKEKGREEFLTLAQELARPEGKRRETSEWTIEEGEKEIVFQRGGRSYRVRGLGLERLDQLKIALRLTTSQGSHLDSLDLYQAKARQTFARMSEKLAGLEKTEAERDLKSLVDELEGIQARRLERRSHQKGPLLIPEKEKEEALSYLKDPNLTERVILDAKVVGQVGEEKNFLLGYLVSISRKLKSPLALLIISQSAAGKTALQDRILFFTPPEDVLKLTRLTDQSLFYQEKDALVHKLIAIEEEEGAQGAGYSIRHLLSAHGLTTMTTVKDEVSGKLVSVSHEVKGPASMMITTTSSEVNYETYTRFIVMTVDESRKQTQEILASQRKKETLESVIESRNHDRIQRLHHNVQRLLRPLEIVNPYAEGLRFSENLLRARREQVKYHSLIKAVALLRQYQKEVKTASDGRESFEYIEVDPKDIEIADTLAREILLKGLDELGPQGRRLLSLIRELVERLAREAGRDPFETAVTRRQIREHTGWSDYQLRKEIQKLVELEYLIPAAPGKRGSRFSYILAWEPEEEGEIPLPSTEKLQTS